MCCMYICIELCQTYLPNGICWRILRHFEQTWYAMWLLWCVWNPISGSNQQWIMKLDVSYLQLDWNWYVLERPNNIVFCLFLCRSSVSSFTNCICPPWTSDLVVWVRLWIFSWIQCCCWQTTVRDVSKLPILSAVHAALVVFCVLCESSELNGCMSQGPHRAWAWLRAALVAPGVQVVLVEEGKVAIRFMEGLVAGCVVSLFRSPPFFNCPF